MAKMPSIHVECPECRAVLEVPLVARLENSDRPHMVDMVIDPDLSEVWLHAWTEHGTPETRGLGEDRG